MPKTKKLADLFVRGIEFDVVDGDDSVTVWLQKLNPLQQDKALRRANGSRAAVLSVERKDNDDEEKLSYVHEMQEIVGDREAALDYLISEELGNLYQVREAELADADEWKKEGYLQGLHDAWSDGLSDTYAMDQEDPEAKRVFDELKRFAESVEKEVQKERKSLIKDYEAKPDEELEKEVLHKVIEASADLEWLKTYRKAEVFFATRKPENHNALYFDQYQEVDNLELETFGALSRAYNDMRVDVVEGKDSQETPAS